MDMVMLEDNHSDSMKKNWLNHKNNNLSNWTLLSFYLPSAIKLVPDKKKNLSLYQLSRISTLSLSTCKENSPSYTHTPWILKVSTPENNIRSYLKAWKTQGMQKSCKIYLIMGYLSWRRRGELKGSF